MRPAAGPKRSRPWKTGERGSRKRSGFARRWTRAEGWASSTNVNRPLSGPTNSQRAGARATGRRGEPTPGSTTTTKTVPPRKVPVDGIEGERARGHVLGRHLVGDVHERRLGAHGQDRALRRPRVGVLETEVRQEGDDGGHARL